MKNPTHQELFLEKQWSATLLNAIKEHAAVIAEEKRMEREYPMGTCNAEDAWRDFFKRKHQSDETLARLAKA